MLGMVGTANFGVHPTVLFVGFTRSYRQRFFLFLLSCYRKRVKAGEGNIVRAIRVILRGS
jgi:hypothetical protein